MVSIYGKSLSNMDQPRRNMTDNLYRDYQRRNEKLKCKQKGILKTVVENIRIGLTSNPINNGKKWVKRTLGQAGLISKVFHVELATDFMEEATNLITEVMKGESVKKYMVKKSDSPKPWPNKNPTRPKRK